MKFCVLGSGSRGNSTFIEHGTTRLLIDAGFSGKEIARRLALINRRPEQLSAIIVTHEHGDHVSGVGVLSRRFQLPVYANSGTHQAAEKRMGKLFIRREFSTGRKFTLEGLEIHPFAVSHDTADPVGFVVSNGKQTMGYCTDTGRLTKLMGHLLGKCQGLILEANHDPQMLKDGPYPLPLLQVLVLAHLSETNNLPELARQAMEKKIVSQPGRPELLLAMQSNPGPLVDLSLL